MVALDEIQQVNFAEFRIYVFFSIWSPNGTKMRRVLTEGREKGKKHIGSH